MAEITQILVCLKCGNQKDYRNCYQCGGEGVFGHDCGEGTRCETCEGEGGWRQCGLCFPFDD